MCLPTIELALYKHVLEQMSQGVMVCNPLTSNPLGQKGSWPIVVPGERRDDPAGSLGDGIKYTPGLRLYTSKFMPFIRFGTPETRHTMQATLPKLLVTLALRPLDEENVARSAVGLQLDIPFFVLKRGRTPLPLHGACGRTEPSQ